MSTSPLYLRRQRLDQSGVLGINLVILIIGIYSMVSIRGRKLLNSVQKGPKNIQAACLLCQNFYRKCV